MFEVLIGSRVQHQWTPGKGLLVAALHGVVLAGVLDVTGATGPPPATPRIDTTAFVLDPLPPVLAPMPAAEFSVPGAPSVELPPVPTEMPLTIPPVSVGPVLDPETIRRAILTGPPGSAIGVPRPAEHIPGAHEVDEPASVVHQPSPMYPAALRVAGVEGRVLVEFVIDTTGRVEPGSLRITESTHRGFDAAALETLTHSRFRPARNGGRAVRQRTVQAMVFRVR